MVELSSALETPRLKRKLGVRSHTAVRQKKKRKPNRKRQKQEKKKQKKKNSTNHNSAWIFQNVKYKKQLVDQNVKLTGLFLMTQRNKIDFSFLSRP